MLTAAKRPRTSAARADKRFVIVTSGLWVLGKAPDPVAEDAPPNPVALASHRPEHERIVLEAAVDGLRTVVVRPGVVYGDGKGLVGRSSSGRPTVSSASSATAGIAGRSSTTTTWRTSTRNWS